jgi:toxin ParE1/3/4
VPGRRCEFTRLAEADLSEIAHYIAADSPKTALRFLDDGSGVRVAVHGHYLIFYAAYDNAVMIERILHASRHLDWEMR